MNRIIVEWEKQCTCWPMTATTGRVTLNEQKKTSESVVVTITLQPGPVCDVCNTPWKEVKSDAT